MTGGGTPRLVFLETSDIGAPHLAAAARSLGAAPLFLCDLRSYQADPLRALLAEPHLDGDTSDAASVVERLRALGEPIAGVTTLADHRLVTAVAVARALGVPGLDPAVARLKDKALVAGLVPERSPPTVAVRRDELTADALRAVAGGGGVVVKPRRGAGGVGFRAAAAGAPLEPLVEHVRRARLPAAFDDGEWIAQARVPGPLVSAEGFASGGVVRLLGFTDRRKIGATESGSRFPVDDALPAERRAEMRAAVEALLGRAGFRRGWFHVEFVVGDGRVWLVDANVGRPGGGPVGHLLSVAFGLDPAVVYRHVLEATLRADGVPDPFPERPLYRAASAVYGMRAGGTLGGIVLPASLASRHVAVLGPGASVPPMGTDDWAWVGMLTGREADVAREMEELVLLGERGPERPAW